MVKSARKWILAVLAAGAIAGGYYGWRMYDGSGLPAGIVAGNGRIEATEIDISARTAGRIKDIFADEGVLVTAGQVLAQMDTDQLVAQRRQAEASLQRAVISIDTARSLLAQREAEKEAAAAVIGQREAELDAAERKLARTEQLIKTNTTSQQILDGRGDRRGKSANHRCRGSGRRGKGGNRKHICRYQRQHAPVAA